MVHSPLIRKLIELAIEEDLAAGDITSELTVPADHRARACVMARERLVFCGEALPAAIFEVLGAQAAAEVRARDGAWAEPDTVLFELAGRTRDLLAAERTLLNFLQRLCGVATGTRRFVEAAAGITVLDTRKTTPGWRLLEKYAMRVGGASNHRLGLGDMVLIKNNHIDANHGDLAKTLAAVMAGKPRYMPVEVEVRSLSELEQAAAGGAQLIMLDNMSDAEIARALRRLAELAPQVAVEVSGGITVERLPALAALGVRCISTGALIARSRGVDIAMRLEAV